MFGHCDPSSAFELKDKIFRKFSQYRISRKFSFDFSFNFTTVFFFFYAYVSSVNSRESLIRNIFICLLVFSFSRLERDNCSRACTGKEN